MNHPLLNPESKHYQMIDGVEAIERLEQMYSKEDLATWAKITAMKYRLRITNKDEINKEATKINGFEAYYTYLTDQRSPKMTVDDAVDMLWNRDALIKKCNGHDYDCECANCDMLRALDEKPVEETMYDAKTTSSKGHKEDAEKAEEAPTRHTQWGTKVGEDSEFSALITALQERIGGNAKVSIVGHSEGNIGLAVEGCDPDELPPSEELAAIIEKFRPRSS